MVSVELERAVIAAAVMHPETIAGMDCRDSDFTTETHAELWRACCAIASKSEPLDAVTLTEYLERELPRDGGWLKTVTTICASNTGANGEHYAKLLRDHAVEREAQCVGTELAQTGDANAAMRALMTLTRESTSKAKTAMQTVKEVVDLMERVRSGETGIRTGLASFDDEFGGLKKSQLYVIGARPKMGKTSFLTTLVKNIGLQKINVGVASAEQPARELMLRMMAAASDLSLHNLARGKISDGGGREFVQGGSLMSHAPIQFYDKPGMAIDDIVMQARRWAYRGELDVLFVDYLQRIRNESFNEMRLRVGDNAHQLKSLALELDVPVVVLSQVNRAVESRTVDANGDGRMPYASDLSESAMIEQEADMIATLYRPSVYIDDENRKAANEHIARLFVCANRHGPSGLLNITWRARTLQFIDKGAA